MISNREQEVNEYLDQLIICVYQAALKDKERIENCRLKDRTGGYHKYVDSAFIFNPDPLSGHFIQGNFETATLYFRK